MLPRLSCLALHKPHRITNTVYHITLRFGRSCPDGSSVSAGEWAAFIQNEICPRFEAFTLTTATGYWQGRPEVSETFSVYVDWTTLNEQSDKAKAIAQAYCTQFNQDAVLYDLTGNHQVAFITKPWTT